MTRKEAIKDLEVIKDFFAENSGAIPLSIEYAIKTLEQEPRKGYISIDDVMSVFDDYMRGEVDAQDTETFLEMLKNKAESENP